MSDRSQQQRPDRGDDRARITNARQAAEALFAPKPRLAEQSVGEATSPAGEAVRKPRVLAASATAPVDHQEPAATPSEPQVMPVIRAAQFTRIRAWVKYGMTARQVAEMYGVVVGEIERILRIA